MSKHKNTRKQRKINFEATCLASYRAGVNLGRKKRYFRRYAPKGPSLPTSVGTGSIE